MVNGPSSLANGDLQRRATACFEAGDMPAALEALDAMASDLQEAPHWHYNRALVLLALRRFDEALVHLEQARQRGMAGAEVACQEGLVWQMRGSLGRALDAYARALTLDPGHALAQLNLGALQLTRKDYPQARDALDAVAVAGSDHPGLAGARWLARRHLMQWDRSVPGLEQQIRSGIAAAEPVCEPFTTLAMADDPDMQRKAASLWMDRPHARMVPRDAVPVPRGPKVRLGYFSADFHAHATMHLLTGVLQAHDRRRFELVLFSWSPPTRDDYQRQAMQAADLFVEVHDRSDRAVADLARELQIDLAIDLKGATHDARPGIFAARAAPVQVNYLGYPGSMGHASWDYLLADAVVVPPGREHWYHECIARLPHSYQPNDSARIRPALVPSRNAVGLPAHAVVLACFNAHYKIGPEVFAVWMTVLRSVSEAVLWLLEGHPQAREHLRGAAAAQGVDPSRLVFAPWAPQPEHLARLPLADLMLDTWPCNAHTTASDALWMGVPMVTLAGNGMAARVGASTLHAVGLSGLVCSDAGHYEALTIALATDRAGLSAWRRQLREALPKAPLFDTLRYTRSLEAAWTAMVERQRAGLAAADFEVREG